MGSKHRQSEVEMAIPVAPSINLAQRGVSANDAPGLQERVAVTVKSGGRVIIKYSGLIEPDGPGFGKITVVNGIITEWLLPTTKQPHPDEVGQPIRPRMLGRWPDDVYALVNHN